MPHMLGKELAAAIGELSPHARVLYMSGYAQPVLASQGTLDPSVILVEKPFTEPALLNRIRTVLDTPPNQPASTAPGPELTAQPPDDRLQDRDLPDTPRRWRETTDVGGNGIAVADRIRSQELRTATRTAATRSPPQPGRSRSHSTGISALLVARNRATGENTTLTLINCRSIVRQVLDVTGLLGPLTGEY